MRKIIAKNGNKRVIKKWRKKTKREFVENEIGKDREGDNENKS